MRLAEWMHAKRYMHLSYKAYDRSPREKEKREVRLRKAKELNERQSATC